METMDLIFSRKSIRNYTNETIPEDVLLAILETANMSPAASGKYERTHMTIIKNNELLDEIDRNTGDVFGVKDRKFLYDAPILVIISTCDEDDSNIRYSNAAILAHTLALAATDLDVGCCYIWGAVMALNQNPALIKQLNLPEGFAPACGIVLGQTAEQYTKRDTPNHSIGINFID